MKTTAYLSILFSITLMVMLSTGAMAGGYKHKIAYAGSYSSHRYAFEPDPEFEKIQSTTRLKNTQPTTVVQTSRGPVPLGAREYYRLGFQTKGAFEPKTLQAGAKLGSAFPKTIYNKDIGKGRELSRIFKP